MNIKKYQNGFSSVLIVLVVVAAVAIGVGVYYSKNKKASLETNTNANINPNVGTNGDIPANTGPTASLRSLIALGGSKKCTVINTTVNGSSSGTVYLSGGKMRGDFNSTVTGSAASESHMIMEGSTTYVWSGTQGMKMDASATASAQGNAQNNAQVDLDQAMSYECSNWSPDNTQFVAPSTVTFVDLSAMMKAQGNLNLP